MMMSMIKAARGPASVLVLLALAASLSGCSTLFIQEPPRTGIAAPGLAASAPQCTTTSILPGAYLAGATLLGIVGVTGLAVAAAGGLEPGGEGVTAALTGAGMGLAGGVAGYNQAKTGLERINECRALHRRWQSQRLKELSPGAAPSPTIPADGAWCRDLRFRDVLPLAGDVLGGSVWLLGGLAGSVGDAERTSGEKVGVAAISVAVGGAFLYSGRIGRKRLERGCMPTLRDPYKSGIRSVAPDSLLPLRVTPDTLVAPDPGARQKGSVG